MASKPDTALDNLARIVKVIEHDQKLHNWFCRMERMPTVQRRNEIYGMVERMEAGEEDADLVISIRLLADSKVFDAACAALGGPHRCAA